MARQVGEGLQVEECVQEPAVDDVDLGGFDLAFLKILMPGRELADDESAGEDIAIAGHGGVRDSEGAGELRAVPDLPVVMGDHGPKSPQGRPGDLDTELREIPLQKSPHELIPPVGAENVGWRQEGAGETAAQPEGAQRVLPNLRESETFEMVEGDPPGKRFGALLQEILARTAQNEETGRNSRPVRQHAQDGKDLGAALDFVQDDEPPKLAQSEHRAGELRKVSRIFKVKQGGRPRVAGQKLPGHRRLTGLAGA